jgi:CubicO group peptidase (beta-lactamase class C family)
MEDIEMKLPHSKILRVLLICFCLVTAVPLRLVIAQEKFAPAYRLPVDYVPIIAKLKEQLPQQMAQQNVPGLAIALVDGETLVWADGFGFTDRANQTKVTAETLFSLQSISKTFTATGLLIAVDKGLLKLDDPVIKLLPQFTVKSRFGADAVPSITFRHLLSHRAGLIHPAPCAYQNRACTFAEHIKSISETWLKFPPGRGFAYSNLGVDVAGYALESSSKKPFDQFMRDELFRPLGMTMSTFNQQEGVAHPALAKGHSRNTAVTPKPTVNIPSGGLYSTARDIAKFISFHLAGGTVAGKQLLPERLRAEMYAPQFPVEGQIGGYGLGIASDPWRRGRLLGHGGRGLGYAASLSWVPEYQVGAVVLTNYEQGDGLAVGTVQRVLQEMIEAKYARRGPAKFTDQPVITLAPDLLQRLEGTYRPDRSSLITFKVKENNLYVGFGNTEVKLDAHSPTEFTSPDQKYTFLLDSAGVPTGVQLLSYSDAQFLPLNDRPREVPGPNKAEWQSFVGKYLEANGNSTTVTIKNGYLYIGWDGEMKLTEYLPGLFFAADGEVIQFQDDKLFLRGFRQFLRDKSGKP